MNFETELEIAETKETELEIAETKETPYFQHIRWPAVFLDTFEKQLEHQRQWTHLFNTYSGQQCSFTRFR